jgi:hypothetical protein
MAALEPNSNSNSVEFDITITCEHAKIPRKSGDGKLGMCVMVCPNHCADILSEDSKHIILKPRDRTLIYFCLQIIIPEGCWVMLFLNEGLSEMLKITGHTFFGNGEHVPVCVPVFNHDTSPILLRIDEPFATFGIVYKPTDSADLQRDTRDKDHMHQSSKRSVDKASSAQPTAERVKSISLFKSLGFGVLDPGELVRSYNGDRTLELEQYDILMALMGGGDTLSIGGITIQKDTFKCK